MLFDSLFWVIRWPQSMSLCFRWLEAAAICRRRKHLLCLWCWARAWISLLTSSHSCPLRCHLKQPSWHLQILMLCLLQIRPISIIFTSYFWASSKAPAHVSLCLPSEDCPLSANLRMAFNNSSFLSMCPYPLNSLWICTTRHIGKELKLFNASLSIQILFPPLFFKKGFSNLAEIWNHLR